MAWLRSTLRQMAMINEAGTPFDSRTHLQELDESTREANNVNYTHALTVGIGTILEAQKIILIPGAFFASGFLFLLYRNQLILLIVLFFLIK